MKIYAYEINGKEVCRSKSPVSFSRAYMRSVVEREVDIKSKSKSKSKKTTEVTNEPGIKDSPEKTNKE